MLFNIIPNELIEKKNEQELVIYFKNGSVYQLKGADDPDALRGAGPYGVVLDEFAKMKYYTWEVIEPILRANGGWCWFIGTPLGKNHLYKMYNLGLKGHSEWKSYLLKASESGIIPADQLEESKRTSTQATWNQEWECEFLEGEGSVFRNVRECMTAKPQDPSIPENAEKIYVMGVDLAKVQDYTVIRVYDRSTNELVFSDRFQTLDWPFQKKRIIAYSRHFHNALVMLDATGVGDPIADDLLRAGVPVEPIKISQQSKKELIEKLSIWIEQKKIKLLPSEQTLLEYDNFSYEIGPTGQIRYGAREGFHDDIVMADALAVWSLQPVIMEEQYRMPSPLQRYRGQVYADYERSIEQKDDWTEWEETTDEHFEA